MTGEFLFLGWFIISCWCLSIALVAQIGVWIALRQRKMLYRTYRHLDHMSGDSGPRRAKIAWARVGLICGVVRWVALGAFAAYSVFLAGFS